MKVLVLFSLLLLGTTVALSQQTNAGPQDRSSASRTDDLKEIERLEIEWNRINEVSDPEGVRRLLADDSYHIGPSGRHYTKEQDVVAQTAARAQKDSSGTSVKFTIYNRHIRMLKMSLS